MGKAAANMLLELGANVVAVGLSDDKLDQFKAEAQNEHLTAKKVNISDRAAVGGRIGQPRHFVHKQRRRVRLGERRHAEAGLERSLRGGRGAEDPVDREDGVQGGF